MIEARLSQKLSNNRILLSLLMVLLYPTLLLAENIPLIKKGGVYEIPVEINGVITLNFVLDTGASEVNIPTDVALTLYRAGTIRDADFLPGKTYSLADGSKVNSSRFVLRSLKIGQRRIANVAASIGSVSSSLLLGQSFLEKLGAWGIDSQKQVLTIGTKTEREESTKQSSIQKAQHRSMSDAKMPEEVDLGKVFIKGNRLSYIGYEIERSFDTVEKQYFVTIKKNDEILVYLKLFKDSNIGLFPFLGKGTKHLIIYEDSGGSQCCSDYKIYELTTRIKLIFDSKEYKGFTRDISIVDIDGDGKYEIVLSSFFRLERLSNADNIYPSFILSYNKINGKYDLEPRRFTNYLLRRNEKYINEFTNISMDVSMNENVNKDRYTSLLLKIMLNYMYAGKETEGWEFYNRTYRFSDKDGTRLEIINNLKEDHVYKAIYGR